MSQEEKTLLEAIETILRISKSASQDDALSHCRVITNICTEVLESAEK